MITGLFCKLSAATLAVMMLVASFAAVAPAKKAAAQQQDCDNNAIIRCGIKSLQDLKDHYNTNNPSDLRVIFAHFGIDSSAEMDGMAKGMVTKSGEVWVNNMKVATGAVTAGRVKMGPDEVQVPGANAWMRPPSTSFRSDSLEAYVKMDGDTFAFAVIISCGNPVSAQNRNVIPPKPQPQPEQPKNPDLSIEKKVRVLGQNEFADAVTADPGDELQYQITVTNTGDTDLTNVEIQDSLPSEVSFTESDLNLAPTGTTADGDFNDLVGNGVTISTLKKGALVQISFTVTIDNEADACEEPMVNNAFASADDVDEKKDSVETTVCQPEEPTPQVEAEQTPPAEEELTKTGAVGAVGAFSLTSLLGFALYRLKEFYGSILG